MAQPDSPWRRNRAHPNSTPRLGALLSWTQGRPRPATRPLDHGSGPGTNFLLNLRQIRADRFPRAPSPLILSPGGGEAGEGEGGAEGSEADLSDPAVVGQVRPEQGLLPVTKAFQPIETG